jgi:NADH:ubiquinone oxidoreductase subunit 4 (subunit M)
MIVTTPLVILMCIVFVLVFLFVQTIDKRKWLTILVSLAITPLIYFYALYPMINIFSKYHHQKYFSTELWIDKPALRYEMGDDMISSKVLIGKTKTEVNSLLGTYEWLSWNETKKIHDTNKWNYSLGIEPGAFNTEKECIEIVFENDKVININPFKELIKFDVKE